MTNDKQKTIETFVSRIEGLGENDNVPEKIIGLVGKLPLNYSQTERLVKSENPDVSQAGLKARESVFARAGKVMDRYDKTVPEGEPLTLEGLLEALKADDMLSTTEIMDAITTPA